MSSNVNKSVPCDESHFVSNTDFEVHKIAHQWTINNFSMYRIDEDKQPKILSPAFSPKSNQQLKFNLGACPNGDKEDSKNHLSIFLFLSITSTQLQSIVIKGSFSVKSKCGNRTIKRGIALQNYESKGSGISKFLSAEELPDFLHNDALTIYLELTAYANKTEIILPITNGIPEKEVEEDKLANDLASLLIDPKHSDVTLIVGDKEIAAHKSILSARSPVFAAMFEHERRPKRRKRNVCEETIENRVKIEDIDLETFESLLQFIYSARVKNGMKLNGDLLIAADKYQVNSLKLQCEKAMSQNLTIDSVAETLLFAELHQADHLKMKCIDYLNRNASQVILTDGWKVMVAARSELAVQLFQDFAVKAKIVY